MPTANGRVWNISAGVAPDRNWVQLIEGNKRNIYFLPKEEASVMMAVATEARRSGFYVNISYTGTGAIKFRVNPGVRRRFANAIDILAN